EVTLSTSAAIAHLGKLTPGHGYTEAGEKPPLLKSGQLLVREALKKGININPEAMRALGRFDVQYFRMAAVRWLVKNNQPLRKFETPAFRKMLRFANPEVDFMMLIVADALYNAASKIHISFNSWSVKGGKCGECGFLGVVVRFASASGAIHDLSIALPQLTGARRGKQIAPAEASR
ncbi:hypothetical protein BU25DRAFT_350288, partial [Macroventuria anomochaeta]